ncbi:MAG: response regulator [Chthoniobacteraceae bacterium]
MSKLIIQMPNGEQLAYELTEPLITIGRHESNLITIADSSVSSQHASLTRVGSHYRLKDLGSTNKTWINGVAVGEVLLDGNYAVRFGLIETVYEEVATVELNVEEVQQQIDSLAAERNAALSEVTGLQEKLLEAQQKVADLMARQQAAQEQEAKLAQKETELAAALERAAEVGKLKTSLDASLDEATKKAAEIEGLKAQVEALQQTKAETEKKLETLEAKSRQQESELASAQSQQEKTAKEMAEAAKREKELNETVASQRESIGALKFEGESLKADRDKWSVKSGQQHAEMEVLRGKVTTLQSLVNELKNGHGAAAPRGQELVVSKRDSQPVSQPPALAPSQLLDPQVIFSPTPTRPSVATASAPVTAATAEPKPAAKALPPPPAGMLKAAGPHTASISKMKALLQRLIQNPSESSSLQSMAAELHSIASWATGAGSPSAVKLAEVLGQLLGSFSDAPERMTPSALRTVSQSLDTMTSLLSAPQPKRTAVLHEAHVMVVDPEAVGREEIANTLRGIGLNCDCLGTAAEALAHCEKEATDLLIVEMNLPDTSVQDFCKQVRATKNCDHAPLLLFTRSLAIENRTQFISAGASDFLAKPIQPAELAVRSLNWILRSRLA